MSRTCCLVFVAVAGLFLSNVGRASDAVDVNDIAEAYVKLVLEVGLYDADYVDAYFGPAQWKPSDANARDAFPAEALRSRAGALIERLAKVESAQFTSLEALRYAFLGKQLQAVRAKINLLAGQKMSFDEESKALYDVVVPPYDEAHIQGILRKLDEALPGEEDIYSRFNGYRVRFTVPRDKLEEVLRAAIKGCRQQTLAHLPLPANERFDLHFFGDKPWFAYAQYQGDGLSLIEVNSDMPWGVAELTGIGAHEIYPGHHVHLSMLDKHLVKDKGWLEFSVLPLYSPLALISEGLAEYGRMDLVMTGDEREEFDRKVLFPLAGLDGEEAPKYRQIMDLEAGLNGAQVEAARRYLDGRMDRDETQKWLCQYCLMTPTVAANTVKFFERYRSYVVNYTVGRQLIASYVERHSGTDKSPARRWQLFQMLLSTPQTPSGLTETK
jgi:hypothetical protein